MPLVAMNDCPTGQTLLHDQSGNQYCISQATLPTPQPHPTPPSRDNRKQSFWTGRITKEQTRWADQAANWKKRQDAIVARQQNRINLPPPLVVPSSGTAGLYGLNDTSVVGCHHLMIGLIAGASMSPKGERLKGGLIGVAIGAVMPMIFNAIRS